MNIAWGLLSKGYCMGDAKRFREFARIVVDRFPDRNIAVADVAGGKGYLQAALRQFGYMSVISFDKRKGYSKKNRQKFYRYEYFDCRKHAGEFGLVVGMHPDAGTDHIIEYGRINRVPFIVCPCCAIPSAVAYWGGHNYARWMCHLEELALKAANRVSLCFLPIAGRNKVIIGEI